jgi:hypothetical protein
MPRRAVAVLAALFVALAAAAALALAPAPVALAAAGNQVPEAVVTGTPPTTPPSAASDTPFNPFIPPEEDLSTCVSANPPPGCGSSTQGGWRQALTLGVMVLGLVFISWRVVVTVRRSRRQLEASGQR